MSGSVGVQGGSGVGSQAGNSTSSNPGGTPAVPNGTDSGAGIPVGIATAQKNATTLFFAIQRNLQPGKPVGVGYFSSQADSQAPFSFYFSANAALTVPYWKPVFPVGLNGEEQVAWIEEGSGGSYLKIVNPSNMETTQVGSIVPARFWDLSYDATKMAGITPDGKAFIQIPKDNLNKVDSGKGSGNVLYGNPGLSASARVQWVNGTQELAVVDPVSKQIELFLAKDLQNPELSLSGESFSASPSGKILLVYSNGQLSRVDRSTGQVSAALNVSVSSFIGPEWNGEGRLAFVDATNSAVQVDVLDLVSNQLSAQYAVQASAIQVSSVSPAWVGSRLYYTAMNQSVWSVWQISNPGADPVVVASSENEDQAYFDAQGVSP
jgi:hypothetical protein